MAQLSNNKEVGTMNKQEMSLLRENGQNMTKRLCGAIGLTKKLNDDGTATFGGGVDFDWQVYLVKKTGELFNITEGEPIPVLVSHSRNNDYPQVYIKGWHSPIQLYRLIEVVFNAHYLKQFVDDRAIINHTTVRFAQDPDGRWHCTPIRAIEAHLDHLEVISSGYNRQHADLINKYGLEYIRIFAEDIFEIEQYLIKNEAAGAARGHRNDRNCDLVVEWYQKVKKIGADFRHLAITV